MNLLGVFLKERREEKDGVDNNGLEQMVIGTLGIHGVLESWSSGLYRGRGRRKTWYVLYYCPGLYFALDACTWHVKPKWEMRRKEERRR